MEASLPAGEWIFPPWIATVTSLRFSATGSGDYQWDTEDQFVTDMQALTGMQNLNTSESTFSTTSLGARYFLKSGGAIALNLTNNFTRFLTGDISEFSTSALIGSFTQPLIRNFGTDIETEVLMQAERDLLYQLRDFTRFRKSFTVRVASDYYSILLNRETARNNYAGLLANNLSLEREQAFQAEGLTTLLEVGRSGTIIVAGRPALDVIDYPLQAQSGQFQDTYRS